MIRYIILIILLFVQLQYAQEIKISNESQNVSFFEIFNTFQKEHSLHFSYAIDVAKSQYIHVSSAVLSVDLFQKLVASQTPYQLIKEGESDYLLVKKKVEYLQVCGVVVDHQSGFELMNANIGSSSNRKVITDANGIFELKVPKQDSILIEYIGYTSVLKKVSDFNQDCDTIRLHQEIQQLKTVVVKDYLTGGVHKRTDGSVVISPKKLRILPGLVEPDILTSIQGLPGVTSPTEDAAALYIRGGTPGENLILLDGIKMYQTGHLFDQISAFNPYIISETQVYRGGTSVRYGDRISGVVSMTTDDKVLDSLEIGAGLNLTHADLFIKTPISKSLGLLASVRRTTADIYDNITTQNLINKVFQNTRGEIIATDTDIEDPSQKDSRYFADTNVKLLWKMNPKNTLKLSSLFTENRLENFAFTTDRTGGEFLVEDIFKVRNLGSSLQWCRKTKALAHVLLAYASYYDQRYKVTDEDFDGIYVFGDDNKVEDYGISYEIDLMLNKKYNLNFGYQFVYNETSIRSEFLFLGEFDNTPSIDKLNMNAANHTVYTEFQYQTPNYNMNLGFRNSYLTNYNNFYLEPRLFSSWEVLPKLRVTTSFELKNQQIFRYNSFGSIDILNPFLPISNNLWLLSDKSNDNIEFGYSNPVVKSSQLTFGVLWKYKGWHVDVEGYYKRIKDLARLDDFILNYTLNIDEDFFGDFPIGNEDRVGVDFLVKKTFHNYRFWCSYTLSETAISYPDLDFDKFPNPYNQQHIFNISQTLKVNDFEFALGWNYASGRPFTKLIPSEEDDYGVIVDPKGINASRYSDYQRLDLSALYRLKPKNQKYRILIGASIKNLLDTKNQISQEYRFEFNNSGNEVLSTFGNRSLRRTPDFVFRLNF